MKTLGSRKLKVPFLSAIINISSHQVQLEIFHMTRDGKESLEKLSRSINLGADISRRGLISLKKMSLLCDIIQEFVHKFKEYDIKYYRVIATCAIREAQNCDVLVTRIKTSSGIDVELLPPAKEIRLLFAYLREQLEQEYDFRKLNTLSFAVGSSSLLLMVSEKGVLKTYETIPLRLLRSFDANGNIKLRSHKVVPLFKSLDIYKYFKNPKKSYTLIAIGENFRQLMTIKDEHDDLEYIELENPKLNSRLRQLLKSSPPQLAEKYDLSEAEASRVSCSAHIIKALVNAFKFKNFIFPVFSFHDALAADMVQRKSKFSEEDLINVAESVGEKYNYNARHVKNVSVNCLKIFDKLYKRYELSKRSRLLLDLAARLHELGRFIDLHRYSKHSYYLIRNISLPGLEDKEKLIIASVASCNRKRIPRNHPRYATLNKDEKSTVNKLTAILLLGDMLDNLTPENSNPDLATMRLSQNSLIIKTPQQLEILKEHDSIKRDSKLFSEIFGLKLKFKGAPGNYEV